MYAAVGPDTEVFSVTKEGLPLTFLSWHSNNSSRCLWLVLFELWAIFDLYHGGLAPPRRHGERYNAYRTLETSNLTPLS